jgi:hypothetical protein
MAKLILSIIIAISSFMVPISVVAQESLGPDGVDIIWESNSYTPAWYSGKALFTSENTLRLIAIPHLEVAPQNTIYTWRVNSTVLGNQSGVGRQTLTLNTKLLDESYLIEVEVSDQSGTSAAKNRIRIIRTPPRLVVYEDNLLNGVLSNLALNSRGFRMKEREVSFKAVPFFFNSSAPVDSITYAWRVNDSLIASTDNKATFGTQDERGKAKIGLFAEHAKSVLQQSSVFFDIIFDDENLFE